jgi:polyisoprenoid-binding protein YceI
MKNQLQMFALLLISSIVTNVGIAQSVYSINNNVNNTVKLLGTSTFHDWEMDAKYTNGEAKFEFNSAQGNELIGIKSLWFSLNVKDLKSDNSALNDNAYKALKSDEYKDIRYQLTSSTVTPEVGGKLIKSKGNLTIAGVTKEIKMQVHCIINADGSVTSKGSYQLKMTDFDVEPPIFMWGAMKTGDALTLNFEINYKK